MPLIQLASERFVIHGEHERRNFCVNGQTLSLPTARPVEISNAQLDLLNSVGVVYTRLDPLPESEQEPAHEQSDTPEE